MDNKMRVSVAQYNRGAATVLCGDLESLSSEGEAEQVP